MLPQDTAGVWAILARHRELYARYVQVLEQDPEDPALPEIRLQMERLFVGHKPSRVVDGTSIYDIHDLTKGDPRALLHSFLWRARVLLRDDPVIAYLGPHEEGMNSELLLVAPTQDQFDIVRRERMDAINQGYDTEGVIGRLRELDAALGIDIVSAGPDRAEFLLVRPPKGEEAAYWGEWLRHFCPAVQEPRKSLRSGRVLLSWD
jgi:hypothetical protein